MKIAIAGFGLEGRANYAYFSREFPKAELVVVDEAQVIDDLPSGVATILGPGSFEKLTDFDMVVRTAGLTPKKIKTNGKVWSATNEFFAKCPATIIGVTGTKGKGTTCSLITSILRAAGKTVHLVGNIGAPALDVLPDIKPDDIVVYELSSFQLWDLEKSPHIAVVLMIEPDHLDVHDSFEEYVGAKANIAKHQAVDDLVIHHPDNQYSEMIAISSPGKKQRYGVEDDGGVYVKANNFCVRGHAICSVDTLHLVGQHNLSNACAAISVAQIFKVDDEVVARGLGDFTGLPHRLKFVAEKNKVKYYDDSIATTPGSAIAALNSFAEPKVMIIGGHDKGADYAEMVDKISQSDSLDGVVLIGESSENLEKLFRQTGREVKIVNLGLTSMPKIVEAASQLARPGGVVILSPAASSFDMFKSYQDRGEQFIQFVKGL